MTARGLLQNETVLPYGEDFTEGGSVCFSKALMAGLDKDRNAFSVYSEYLDLFLLAEQDSRVSSLQARPYLREKIRAQLFHRQHPDREPQLFSFFSPPCLARLSKQLNLELVFYRMVSGTLTPYCDFRLASGETGHSKPPTLGILFGCGRNQRDRFLCFEDVNHLDHDFNLQVLQNKPLFVASPSSPILWTSPFTTQTRHSVLGSVETVLLSGGIIPEVANPLEPLPGIVHPWELVEDDGTLTGSLWKRWNKEVLVVTFTQDSFGGKDRMRGHSKPLACTRCKFSVLSYISPPTTTGALPQSVAEMHNLSTAPVVCLWPSGVCSLLSSSFAQEVRRSFLQTAGTGERLANSKLRGFVPPSKARVADRLAKLAAKKNARARKIDETRKWCECETCSKSTEYDQNMSKAGPERLITTDYTLQQLLQMLGLWKDGSTETLLDRVCELSVASMDIESRTVKLDLAAPGPGPNIRYGEIDVAALENHARFVQVPVMMAHMDGISAGQERNPEGIFTVADDSEEAIRSMMKAYLEWILKSQRACAKAKAELLAPFLDITRQYKEAFMSYCQDWHQKVLLQFEDEENTLRQRTSQSPPESAVRPPKRPAETTTAWNWDDFILPTAPSTSAAPTAIKHARQEDFFIQQHAWMEESSQDNTEDYQDETEDSGESSADTGREMLYKTSMRNLVSARPRCFFKPAHFALVDANKLPKEGTRSKKERDFFQLAVRAWTHTIPGRLEKLLLRLIEDYSIFSFYG